MTALARMFIMITIFFSQCLYVASAENSVSVKDYVKVCTENQNNKIDSDLYECMGNEGKKLSEMGPSKCANELATQQNSSDTPDNSDSAAGTASESSKDAASATVSESTNSAIQ